MYVTDIPVIDRMTDSELAAQDQHAREEHNANLQAHLRATRRYPKRGY